MSRIRSLHPAQWTDDQFVQMSPLARLLAIAVRNHTDDNGIFEWNPAKLKMTCLPNDNCDTAALLEELVRFNQVRVLNLGGRQYGQVRNFAKFQRIKKPKFTFPTPDDFPTGYELNGEFKPPSSPPVPNQFGNSSADVGGRRKEVGGKDPESPETYIEKNPDRGGHAREAARCPAPAEPDDPLEIPIDVDRTDEGQAVRAWNAMVVRSRQIGGKGFAEVQRLTETRRRALRKRLAECGGLDGWHQALAKVEASDFLAGRSKDWRADFDFLLKASKFTKLMEGGYDNRTDASRPVTTDQHRAAGFRKLFADAGAGGPAGDG